MVTSSKSPVAEPVARLTREFFEANGIRQGGASGEGGDVLQGGGGNVVKGFVGQKGLMRGDEDVGKGQQAGEGVVLEYFLGEVAKEDAFLFFVDIKAGGSDDAGFERINEGAAVDECTAAGIDQHHAWAHLRERGGIDQMVGLWCERNVQRNHIGALIQFSE